MNKGGPYAFTVSQAPSPTYPGGGGAILLGCAAHSARRFPWFSSKQSCSFCPSFLVGMRFKSRLKSLPITSPVLQCSRLLLKISIYIRKRRSNRDSFISALSATGDCKNGAFSTAKEKLFADESIHLSINDNFVN